jgi:hypothetical protein
MNIVIYTFKLILKLSKKGFKTLLYNREQFTLTNVKKAVIGSYREYELIKILENNKLIDEDSFNQERHNPLKLPPHKLEQFYYRISIMNPKCIDNKQCPCTCEVFGRQLIDNGCDEKCYPYMMDADTWKLYKEAFYINIDKIKETVLPLVIEYYKSV